MKRLLAFLAIPILAVGFAIQPASAQPRGCTFVKVEQVQHNELASGLFINPLIGPMPSWMEVGALRPKVTVVYRLRCYW